VARVGLVTALLPPSIGGTQVLVWRLFQGDPELAVVAGVPQSPPSSDEAYSPLAAPTLWLPYPRLRGYRYGLAPALGAYAVGWLAAALVRVVRFLRAQGVDHVVSIPHQGPFALLGLLAARQLGVAHTLYILDAWEEGATGPVERALIHWGLRYAARMPRSRVAVVSPALGDHYRDQFGFRDVTWIPNPAPLPEERFAIAAAVPEPIVVFTGGIKPFNLDTIRLVVRSVRKCKVVKRLILTGQVDHFAETLRAHGELHDRVEFRLCSRAEIAALQAQAAVLLVATNAGDTSRTSLGYLPGRLPEYVSTRRPILLIGPHGSEAARAVRHWALGPTTTSQDEGELADLLDAMAMRAMNGGDGDAAPAQHDLFLELFSRQEARRRLLGGPAAPLSRAASELGAAFERSPRG
jgi:hypothetical protein